LNIFLEEKNPIKHKDQSQELI